MLLPWSRWEGGWETWKAAAVVMMARRPSPHGWRHRLWVGTGKKGGCGIRVGRVHGRRWLEKEGGQDWLD